MAFLGAPIQTMQPEQLEAMKKNVATMLNGIDRYNPNNLSTLENHVSLQCRENFYDLEANLTVLKLYQFNPQQFKGEVVAQVLLKALTNLPHTDFVLCKCLIDIIHLDNTLIADIMELHREAEQCEFQRVWERIRKLQQTETVTGFENSMRNYICICVNMTYQKIEKKMLCELLNVKEQKDLKLWMDRFGWKACGVNDIFIANHEENIKTKSILEKIEFESVEDMMGACR